MGVAIKLRNWIHPRPRLRLLYLPERVAEVKCVTNHHQYRPPLMLSRRSTSTSISDSVRVQHHPLACRRACSRRPESVRPTPEWLTTAVPPRLRTAGEVARNVINHEPPPLASAATCEINRQWHTDQVQDGPKRHTDRLVDARYSKRRATYGGACRRRR